MICILLYQKHRDHYITLLVAGMVEGHDKTGQLLPTDAASAAVQQHLATGKARIGPCPK